MRPSAWTAKGLMIALVLVAPPQPVLAQASLVGLAWFYWLPLLGLLLPFAVFIRQNRRLAGARAHRAGSALA